MRARSVFCEKMEGEIGERERRLGSKGQNPRGVERVHGAVNPLRRPRSPLPAPASQPSALLSSIPAGGRDPVEGDTAPGQTRRRGTQRRSQATASLLHLAFAELTILKTPALGPP